MLLGIGIDLVDVSRITKSVSASGDDFLRQFLTPAEISVVERNPARSASLFAAKEAFSKALGTGIYGSFSFQDIEIRGDLRKPTVYLSGRAREIAEERGITKIHVSLTSDSELAAAVVVLE